jgi:RNA-binding protein
MITARMKRRIKHELANERPTIWIGKEGTTAQIVKEIDKQLEMRKMVKIRVLKTALKDEEAENLASKVAEQTGSILVEVRGHTFMLYRHRKHKRKK